MNISWLNPWGKTTIPMPKDLDRALVVDNVVYDVDLVRDWQSRLCPALDAWEQSALEALRHNSARERAMAETTIQLELYIRPFNEPMEHVYASQDIDDHTVLLPIEPNYRPSILDRVFPILNPVETAGIKFENVDTGELIQHMRQVHPTIVHYIKSLIHEGIITYFECTRPSWSDSLVAPGYHN